MAERIRIGVVYGGRSSEHAVSVLSAGSVLSALDPERYEIVTVGITRAGRWVRTDGDASRLRLVDGRLPEITDGVHDSGAVDFASDVSSELAATPAASALMLSTGSALAELDGVDVVFPVLHGAFGEDGTIQGLLEMAGVRYVGSGVLASAGAMDKVFAKTVLTAAGLEVAPYFVARRGRPVSVIDVEHLGLPLFVKPARGGSSVGITRVESYDALPDALETAYEHDSKVLIEAMLSGRELECGVLQDADGTVTASLPAEIRLHADVAWYDFDAKYLDDASEFDIPADIGEVNVKVIQDVALRAFEALECAGLARVDCFLTDDGRMVVNEVNTMPGFTPISMYPKMFAESGVPYPELLDRLIATALARP